MAISNLPSAKASQHIKTFEQFGWLEKRRKGSHVVLCKQGHRASLTIPDHGKEVSRTLLARLLRAAEISEDDYLRAFKKR